jgi:hypothetical protein
MGSSLSFQNHYTVSVKQSCVGYRADINLEGINL